MFEALLQATTQQTMGLNHRELYVPPLCVCETLNDLCRYSHYIST